MSSNYSLMSSGAIPEPVQQLVLRHIYSFERLDVVLLLLRSPNALDSAQIASRVNVSLREVREILAELSGADLLEQQGSDLWSCRPKDGSLSALARLFEDEPVRLLRWMSKNSVERARRAVTSSLADILLRRRR